MRTRTSLKLIALILLAVCTSTITSSILAQVKRKKSLPPPVPVRTLDDDPDTPVGETVFESDEEDLDQLKAMGRVAAPRTMPPYVFLQARMDRVEAVAHGQEVSVWARVSIQDRRHDSAYVWRLQAFTGPKMGAAVFDHLYADQAFTKTKVDASPTLAEEIQLASGIYHIQVTLYGITHDTDPTVLSDPAIAKRARIASGGQRIIVGN